MSSVPAFISELVRAANEIDKVSRMEKCSLLERAAYTLLDMRERIAMSVEPEERAAEDPTYRWRIMSLQIDQETDADVAAALLESADLIRAAHILLDARYEVILEDAKSEERH